MASVDADQVINDLLEQRSNKRRILCTRDPSFPYVVKKVDSETRNVDTQIELSIADALATWLHNWSPAVLKAFLDFKAYEDITIEQVEKAEDGTLVPVVHLSRVGADMKIKYFSTSAHPEYFARMDGETGHWQPLGARLLDKDFEADDPKTVLVGQFLASSILNDEAWETLHEATLRISYTGEDGLSKVLDVE